MNETQKTAVWRLVEKVERAGQVRLGGGTRAEDWRELAELAAECREMLVADTVAAAEMGQDEKDAALLTGVAIVRGLCAPKCA